VEVQHRDAELLARPRRPVLVEGVLDRVRPGDDDDLVGVGVDDRLRERRQRVVVDDRPRHGRTGRLQRRHGPLERLAGLLPRLDLGLALGDRLPRLLELQQAEVVDEVGDDVALGVRRHEDRDRERLVAVQRRDVLDVAGPQRVLGQQDDRRHGREHRRCLRHPRPPARRRREVEDGTVTTPSALAGSGERPRRGRVRRWLATRPADVVDVFVYVVVLNLAIEHLPAVMSESFTISLLTAVLLTIALEAVLLLKAAVLRRWHAATTRGAKVLAGGALWLVAAGSKLVVLELVALVFGDSVSLGGFVQVTVLVLALLAARAAVRRLLGEPAESPGSLDAPVRSGPGREPSTSPGPGRPSGDVALMA